MLLFSSNAEQIERGKNMFVRITDIIKILIKRFWIILLCSLLGAGIAFSYTYFFVPKKYTSSASLYVHNEASLTEKTVTAADLSASKQLVSTYIVMLKSDLFLESVVAELPDYKISVESLKNSINAQSINNTEVLKITTSSTDPATAQAVTNKITELFPNEIRRVAKIGGVEIIDSAKLPTVPSWPIVKNSVLLAAIFAVASACIVLIRDSSDTTVHSETDLTNNFNIPVIGSVPKITISEKRGRI